MPLLHWRRLGGPLPCIYPAPAAPMLPPGPATPSTEKLILSGYGSNGVTVTAYDLDGDGVPDAIEKTTVTGYDLDGDGTIDVIETTTIEAADVDGDGTISDDEVTGESIIAVREGMLDEGDKTET